MDSDLNESCHDIVLILRFQVGGHQIYNQFTNDTLWERKF